ncbi:hypothetical protein BV898_07703 [Hypsibius exemplaris]|uniref:Cytochrome c oxidase assembly protein COX20, mitochondrial n=1 Tax=Hypsibius exemplaris TaxID=2072580 RepID=A0A1W0WSZ9_HYPEX|nr:hypothetical protein BV898_07703 [Hypsibius exemplaris]
MAAPVELDVEQAILDYEEARDAKRSAWKVMGRRPVEIPCFRDSFMYGILGGLGIGLGFSLATSRVGRACDVAVASFSGITITNWCYCRYEKARHALELARFKYEINAEVMNVKTTDSQIGDPDTDVIIYPKSTAK